MSDKILIVTSPDDTLLDGIRILHIELTQEQNQMISSVLLKSSIDHAIINYVWQLGDPVAWLLDKKSKCDVIFFNAGTSTFGLPEILVGYIAAHSNSYYFGQLKDLYQTNPRAILEHSDIATILNKAAINYTQR